MSDSKEPTKATMTMMMRPEDDWGMRIFYHPRRNPKLIDELCKNAYESAHKMWPQLPVKTRNFLGAPLLAEAPEYCKTLEAKMLRIILSIQLNRLFRDEFEKHCDPKRWVMFIDWLHRKFCAFVSGSKLSEAFNRELKLLKKKSEPEYRNIPEFVHAVMRYTAC